MPGKGKSGGEQMSFRTKFILDPNGPGELVKQIIQHLKIDHKNVVLMGYDWGAAISLRLGVQNPKSFSHIISFMPAYGESEDNRDELKSMQVPTMMLWVKQDQLHPWPKFKNLAQKIPQVDIQMVDIKLWRAEMAQNLYQMFSRSISERIFQFLNKSNQDASQNTKSLLLSKKENIRSTHAQDVISRQQIVFSEDIDKEELSDLSEKPSLQASNIYFKQNYGTDLNDIIDLHQNNTLPQTMQQKLYIDTLLKVVNKNNEGEINRQNRELFLHFSVLKAEIIRKKKYNFEKIYLKLQNIQNDQFYFRKFITNKIEEININTDYGKIHCYFSRSINTQNEQEDNKKKTIIAMHGDGASSDNQGWLPVMEQFNRYNFDIYSISMPGYGKSTGSQFDFRRNGVQVLEQIVNKLSISKPIIMGRSVGGRTSIEYAYKNPYNVSALILIHPVVPNDMVLSSVFVPSLLFWAKDDGEWDKARGKSNAGHPYFGPHGAAYVKSLLKSELISWNEQEFSRGPRDFYEEKFVDLAQKYINKLNL